MQTCGVISRVALACFAAWLAAPIDIASACQPPHCAPDYFLPFDGEVPANIAGIQWRPGRGSITGGGPELTTADGLIFQCEDATGVLRDIAFHVEADGATQLIVPDDALVAGERCEIGRNENLQYCDPLGYMAPPAPTYLLSVAQFAVKQAALEPGTLGELRVQDAALQTVSHSVGTCGARPGPICGVAVDLALAEDAAFWSDALVFETLVDGAVWESGRYVPFRVPTGGSFEGRGKDLIYAQTADPIEEGTDPGTTLGTHSVIMRATLPGTALLLETAPIEINLDCGDQLMPDGGEPGTANPSGGCSCSIVGPRATHSFAWAWSLALITLLIARRVRSSRAASRARAG